jgi:xanthine/CO dehydrogenase XdhC/CoxF family maturation factor
MDSSLPALVAFYADCRTRDEPIVLATVTGTAGSTYRKAGGRMLLRACGDSAGLLSGGCLESDLLEHARAVLECGAARIVEYDQRTMSDAVWGLGMGCEGAMRILLQPLLPRDGYHPFATFAAALETRRPVPYASVVATNHADWPLGRTVLASDVVTKGLDAAVGRAMANAQRAGALNQLHELEEAAITLFIGCVHPPPRLLVLGGGPDAVPVVEQAALLGWPVTLVDHRPAYAVAERFVRAERVVLARPEELDAHLDAATFDAAVVMSHHLVSDAGYLGWLARSPIRYVGLLGPAARRERLHAELPEVGAQLSGRLFGPVGLDIGAATPEAIALAIVAEIHAVLSGRHGGPFSITAPPESRV